MSYYIITTTGGSAPTCFVKVRTEPRRKEDISIQNEQKGEEDDE